MKPLPNKSLVEVELPSETGVKSKQAPPQEPMKRSPIVAELARKRVVEAKPET